MSRQVSGQHWESFYASGFYNFEPSSFAEHISQYINLDSVLADVGCGNGRDSAFFYSRGARVVGFDPASSAIDLCNRSHPIGRRLTFVNSEYTDAPEFHLPSFNMAYVRFVLHAMTETAQNVLLSDLRRSLEPGALLFIETRSVQDPLMGKGMQISENEWVSGHYRRFLDLRSLETTLTEFGFVVDDIREQAGVTPVAGDDPVVLRARARVPRLAGESTRLQAKNSSERGT